MGLREAAYGFLSKLRYLLFQLLRPAPGSSPHQPGHPPPGFEHPGKDAKPTVIAYDPMFVVAGPELVRNGSFEDASSVFSPPDSESYSENIRDWSITSSAPVRWIGPSHPWFGPAAHLTRFIDLSKRDGALQQQGSRRSEPSSNPGSVTRSR
jgi:hypothetical protein